MSILIQLAALALLCAAIVTLNREGHYMTGRALARKLLAVSLVLVAAGLVL